MKNLMTNIQQGMQALQSGNYKLAISLCDEVIKTSPLQADALHILALTYRQLNQFDLAKNYFLKSLASSPNQPICHLNLANLLVTQNEQDDAIIHFDKAMELAPNHLEILYKYALFLNRAAKYKAAVEIITRAIKLNSQNVKYYNVLGNAYKNQHKYEHAITAFEKALAIEENNFFALHNMGVTYRMSGSPSLALSLYKKILIIGQNIPELHFNIGCAYYDLGEYEKAEDSLKTAISLRPDYILAHETLNNLYWEHSKKDQFLTSYHLYLDSKNASSPMMHFSLAAQLILAKREKEAIETLKSAIKQHGEVAEYCHALSILYAKKNCFPDEALELITKAINAQPKNVRFRIDLANVYIKNYEYKLALEQLDTASVYAPLNQEIWAYKGICWRLLQDEREQWLNNYDQFVIAQTLDVPSGYDNLEHFILTLKETLKEMHQTTQQPLDQSVMGGTQTLGNLLLNKSKVIQDFKDVLTKKATQYIKNLPRDPSHPFLNRISDNFEISGCWSVLLNKGGFHTNHVHPDGWFSGPSYISVPKTIYPDDPNKSGWVKFGETSLGLGERESIGKEVCPQEGLCVFFPSYIWHGTYAFNSENVRITAPCDIHPVN